jgi:DNA-binding transcriptional regulator PaaX
MQPRTRAKYGAITQLILKLIAAGALTGLAGLSYSPTRTNRALAGLSEYGEEQIKRCLLYLRMQRYINYSPEDSKSPLIITKKGLLRLSTNGIKDKLRGVIRRRWDHLWRLVAFDVPESKKYCRDMFRQDLLRYGFFPFQKSIYITPFACENEIRDLARKHHVGQYVLVSVTPNIGWRESYAINWFEDYVLK